MTHSWTEAEVADFLAGRLRVADADRIAEALETDPAAQAVAERLGAAAPGDAMLRAAFAAPMDEPAPELMRSAVGVQARQAAKPPRRPGRAWAPTALAAGVALAAGLGAGFSLRSVSAPAPAGVVAVGLASGPVGHALETAPAGASRDHVAPTATFRDGTGNVCREFDMLDPDGAPSATGVACRAADGGWRVLLVAAHPAAVAAGSGFAPAAGWGVDPIAHFVDAIGAGPVLSPVDEAALIARRWR